MANITNITATLDDGTTVVLFPVAVAAAPTITEVKVEESDGTEVVAKP